MAEKNTVATKKTQLIDINIYSNNLEEFNKITLEYQAAIKDAKTSIKVGAARIIYEENIYKTLSDVGKKIFSCRLGMYNRSKVKEVKLKNFELPKNLISIKEMKGNNSLELIYRKLFKNGSTKYIIADSLIRYNKDYVGDCLLSENPYLITIPYEEYLKLIN